MIWTAPMDDTLTAAWHASLPTHQIAALVGPEATASAVRSRARRLNLPERGVFEAAWSGKYKGRAAPDRLVKPLPDLRKLGPDSAPVIWAARDWRQCAFPVGDGEQGLVVCGGPIKPGARRPYCPFHASLTVSASHAA
jgi:hypothetical protein